VIRLRESAVHVWWLSLSGAEPEVEAALAAMTSDERERALRFRFARDRRRFVVARTAVRLILGEYTGLAPLQIPLRLSDSGKPYLADRSDLRFNLSHCEDRGVLAVSRHPCGIDLERIRDVPEALEIAQRLFTASENRALRAISSRQRPGAFLRCWTRKEAFVKARGEGLATTPLRSFDVTLNSGTPALTLRGERPSGKWTIRNLPAGPGWIGALVVGATTVRLRFRDWPADLPPQSDEIRGLGTPGTES
jgi:4'-phosphopantetheinyl transferase